jgi:hypothetical protein
MEEAMGTTDHPFALARRSSGILETLHEHGEESLSLRNKVGKDAMFADMVGSSGALQAVLSLVAKARRRTRPC